MSVVEIILLAGGVGVFIASYFVGNKQEDEEQQAASVNTDLSEADKKKINEQIDSLIQEKLDNLSEQTEAKMDKISTTKILELNDYAQTVMDEINRNHNETVFLYDMLNEKAKEVKNTVKDVNIAKKEVKRISSQLEAENAANGASDVDGAAGAGTNGRVDSGSTANGKTVAAKQTSESAKNAGNTQIPSGSKDLAKERLMELVKKNNERIRQKPEIKAGDIITAPGKDDKTEAKTAVKEETKTDAKSANNMGIRKSAKSEGKTSAKEDGVAESKPKTVRRNTKKAAEPAKEEQPIVKAEEIAAGFDENMTNNERIVELSKRGISNKEIAKLLNIGIGEVKLVVDLYNSAK